MFNKMEFLKLRLQTGLEYGYSGMNQEQFAVYLMNEIPTLRRMSQKKISRWESVSEKYGGTPKHYELCQLSHWIAGKYGKERAIAITGLDPSDLPDKAFDVPIRQKFNRRAFKIARRKLNLTQKQMGKELGDITQKTISFWENGKNAPTFLYLEYIHHYFSQALGTDVANGIACGLDGGTYDKLRNIPAEVTQPPPREIVMVTYESGVIRWFPHTTDTLNQIVIDFDSIKEVAIIEQGGMK